MEIVYLIIGIVIGGVVAFLLMNSRKKDVDTKLMLTAQRLDQEEKVNAVLRQLADDEATKSKGLSDELTQARINLASLQSLMEAEREQNSKTEQIRREQFQEQLRTVQEQFQNLATRVLDQTSDKLKTQNAESMQTLTTPLRQNLEQLQQAIRNTNNETARQTATLSEQLKSMAEQTSKINQTATRLTNVMRGGKKVQIDAEDLTIGDYVLLESGDKISADMRIAKTRNFMVDESILTGESLQVEKGPAALNRHQAPISEQSNMVFAGTTAVSGRAEAIVVAIGAQTE